MAVLATWNPLIINEVFATSAITTAEAQINIVCAPLNPGSFYPGRPEVMVQIRADVAWFYRTAAGGNNYPIAAGEVFNFRIINPMQLNYVYCAAQTTTGIIYGMRIA